MFDTDHTLSVRPYLESYARLTRMGLTAALAGALIALRTAFAPHSFAADAEAGISAPVEVEVGG